MEIVSSSMIAKAGYDADIQVLYLEFPPKKTQLSGAVYAYKNFGPSDWTRFRQAESLGKFFGQEIKGKYPAERIKEPIEKPVESESAT